MCLGSGLVPDWHRPPGYIYNDLMYTHKIDHRCSSEMAACVTYECDVQTHASSWLVAGLQYLQCIYNRDAAVLHNTIDIVCG